MWQGLFYFGLGLMMDMAIVLYYRAISSRMVSLAVILSILVTAVPFLVAERGILTKRRLIFIWYALGAGVGTAIGMIIQLS
jgi:heme/copper-type cytochrome/quinol oxidase subunit 4